MNPRVSNQKTAAMTLVEVLVVIAVLFILAALLLPTLPHSGPSWRSQCVQNLKQVGLAFRVWADDHNGKFPMQVSVTNWGTMELTADGRNPWLNFLVLSSELSTPKTLYCPADQDRVPATSFTDGFSAKNISYFVGLDADTNHPQMLLSGDDNFVVERISIGAGLLAVPTNGPIVWTASSTTPSGARALNFWTNTPIAWADSRHELCGNVVFADSSVRQVSNPTLTNLLRQTGMATNRLAIP